MFEFITKRSLFINVVGGFGVVVFFLFLLYTFLGPITRHGKTITVPNVQGKNIEEATEILSSVGFDVEIQDSIFTDTASKGVVLKQIPEGDAVVKIYRKIYLTVNSQLPPFVEMPNLIGFSIRNAEMQLKNLGIKVNDTIYKPDFAKNAVLEQLHRGVRINPGEKIQQGSGVTLVLGDGLGNLAFSVPSLIGKSFGDAKLFLESYGLNIFSIILDAGVKDTAAAFVYWQSPSPVDESGIPNKIRQGQTLDVRLSMERPTIDTIQNN